MSLAAALLLDVGLAEDVVHDVFIAFLDSAERFRLTGSLKGYLATCVANRARNVNKVARRRCGTSLDDVPERPCDAPPPEQAAIFSEQLGRLTEALQQLPYEQREALLLRSHSGLLGWNILNGPHSGVAWAAIPDHTKAVDTFLFRLTIGVREKNDASVSDRHTGQFTFYLSEQYGFRVDISGDGATVSWYVPPSTSNASWLALTKSWAARLSTASKSRGSK